MRDCNCSDKVEIGGKLGRAWNMTVQVYSESTLVPVEANCTGFMFTNVGDTIARVNGMVIFPSATPATSLGDSRSVSASLLDIYKGNISLAFDPGGVAPQVEIVQTFYVDNENIKLRGL